MFEGIKMRMGVVLARDLIFSPCDMSTANKILDHIRRYHPFPFVNSIVFNGKVYMGFDSNHDAAMAKVVFQLVQNEE